MISQLTTDELYTYLRLCEANMEYLGTKRHLGTQTRKDSINFNYTASLRTKLYEEINIRLKELTKKDEHTEEDIQQTV